ncbi:MAG: SirB2 family protein [Pseudomonadota bacterium]
MYLAIKYLHIYSVFISGIFFVVRGYWMIRSPERLERKWVKVVPHIVDSVLLASAITLMILIQAYPLQSPWIMAKIVALILYIVTGTIALKRGKTLEQRKTFFFISIGLFIYILGVAKTHHPLWGIGV